MMKGEINGIFWYPGGSDTESSRRTAYCNSAVLPTYAWYWLGHRSYIRRTGRKKLSKIFKKTCRVNDKD